MLKGEACITVLLYLLEIVSVFDQFIFHLLNFFNCSSRTGMAGVPGTASAIFSAVKDVGANVIMISQVIFSFHHLISV